MVKGEMVIEVPYGVDFLRLRLRVMSVIPHFLLHTRREWLFSPFIEKYPRTSWSQDWRRAVECDWAGYQGARAGSG